MPAIYVKLYEHHIKVIEHSLVPMIEALGGHLKTTSATCQNVEAVTGELRTWIAKQSGAPRKDLRDDEVVGG